ncbi:uncharacterized protein G2W53_015015 [Senna tora]|uniref:Uncharacterized protein n=1 Tax=Senna tora TaxID=362788 RepID=A0A835C934_9FABA|nr:uncharacterized protein G2W53_015015 [Senna tora]
MATGQISRRRRLVAADRAGENAEVLRESEGDEASIAAEEEVFGLEVSEGNLLLYTVRIFHSLSLIYPNKFIGRFSLSLAQPLKHSHRRQKLSSSKEDLWPPDRSIGAVVSLHQIPRRCRLVATDLAGENAEVLRESEREEASTAAEGEVFGLEHPFTLSGENAEVLQESEREEASTTAEEEVFGLEVSEGNLLLYTVRIFHRFGTTGTIDNDFDISRLSFVLPLMLSLLVASLSLAQSLKHSHRRQKLSPSKEDPWPPDRSLGAVVALHQISRHCRLVAADLAGENAKVLRESEGEVAYAFAEEEMFGLEVSEGNLLLYSV